MNLNMLLKITLLSFCFLFLLVFAADSGRGGYSTTDNMGAISDKMQRILDKLVVFFDKNVEIQVETDIETLNFKRLVMLSESERGVVTKYTFSTSAMQEIIENVTHYDEDERKILLQSVVELRGLIGDYREEWAMARLYGVNTDSLIEKRLRLKYLEQVKKPGFNQRLKRLAMGMLQDPDAEQNYKVISDLRKNCLADIKKLREEIKKEEDKNNANLIKRTAEEF